MAEENPNPSPNPMNLDLNLGPLDSSSDIVDFGSVPNPNTGINLTNWLEAHRVRQVVRNRTRRPSPWSRQLHLPSEAGPRGDVSYECRTEETTKTCQNKPKSCTEDNADGEKDELTKKSVRENGFFDCNICFDLAKDPVVTCCGHLFCWPCLYRWLHHHSAARECPVCKGEVNLKNVVPIYGRGGSTRGSANMDSILPVPGRPQAQRVESWRQSVVRNASVVPLEELITRPATTVDLPRGLAQREQNQNSDPVRVPTNEFRSLLHDGILTSGVMRGDSPTPGWNSDDVDFLRDVELVLANESLLEPYMDRVSIEVSPALDDRDSLSSIAAMIQSESQTVDNNVIEIDSTVAPSTSSRRRNDASRILEADSGDSQAPRRRRLL